MHRIAQLALLFWVFSGALSALTNHVSAAVVILANRAETAIRFEALRQPGTTWRRHVIGPGDCIALALESSETMSVRGAGAGSYRLTPYGMYYFGSTSTGSIELREIGLATPAVVARREEEALIGAQANLGLDAPDESDKGNQSRRTISIAVYVDDEEPTVDQVWRKRLADRVGEASEILERSCGMRLAVKSFGRWETSDAVDDFELSLREFERKVRPKDVHVAIGFTNQYQITRGRTHLGGTHGPLHSHILVREWSQHVNEPERLELLVHELAHFLGAAHSPESNSVMRPLLGDRQARARAFRIAIDPVNALAMSVVGEEIRDRGITSFAQLSEPSRARLEAVYTTLAQAMPNDPAPNAYLRYVRQHKAVP
jgi:hypothetical protein